MAAPVVWNVFLPVDLLNSSSGYLTGCIHETTASVYVTSVCSDNVHPDTDTIVGKFTSVNQTRIQQQRTFPASNSKQTTVWLNISLLENGSVECQACSSAKRDPCQCVCILIETQDILSSYSLLHSAKCEQICQMESRATTDSVSVTLLANVFSVYHLSRSVARTEKTGRKHRDSLLERVFACCLFTMTVFFAVVEKLVKILTFKWFWSHVCAQCPATVCHISYKLSRFQRLRNLKKSEITIFDVCGQQLLDSMLGVTVMVYVINTGMTDFIATMIMQWADITADYLNDLLHWLMGAPAGLKLNAQLTEYLGHFFLYHVYLWSGYLNILRPNLGWVLWTAAGFGVLGLSSQLCFIQDIISMLTLHIYCFYVYAARLYSLQTYALSSLWRLFRGKKWNVLRLRVDSALYNIDQLCVGTLLFTVLLFLLPTTLLYYSVFTALRLLVLSFHGVLMVLIQQLNTIPVASVLLRFMRSKLVAGDIVFEVQSAEKNNSSLVLTMKASHLPLPKLYHRAKEHLKLDADLLQKTYLWSELLHKVVSGNLVYPWVNT